jgi:hypothetical protein
LPRFDVNHTETRSHDRVTRVSQRRISLFLLQLTHARTRARARACQVWSPQHAVAMHKPETWGYVQFSAVPAVAGKAAAATSVGGSSAGAAGCGTGGGSAAPATTDAGATTDAAASAAAATAEAAAAATVAATTTVQLPAAGAAGKVFVQDASWPLRCFLMEGYYAQVH